MNLPLQAKQPGYDKYRLPKKGENEVPKSSDKKYSKEELQTVVANMRKTEIYESIKRIFASMYVLQAKTRRFRWNHDAPWKRSEQLAELLRKEEEILSGELDLLAKRISELGFTVPGALLKITDLSRLQQNTRIPGELAIYHQLMADNRTLTEMINAAIETSWNSSDYPTTKLLRSLFKFRQTSAKAFERRMEDLQESEPATELTLSSLTASYN